MANVTLNNGLVMPLLGYGTYQIPPPQTEACVAAALRAGYRSIDTGQCYGNEEETGRACRKAGLDRADLFVTTKLWGCRGYDDTRRSIEASRQRLGLGPIDLLLLHEPSGHIPEIYRAMEDAYRDGSVRAIGVANFLEEAYLDLVNHCRIIPAVNQVETHVFRQQGRLRRLEGQIGTQHESWSPLACGRHGIWHNPVLLEIGKKHSASVAQVALAFLVEQGIVVIPKSTSATHMEENLAAQRVSLDAADMEALEALDEGKSLFNW